MSFDVLVLEVNPIILTALCHAPLPFFVPAAAAPPPPPPPPPLMYAAANRSISGELATCAGARVGSS